MTDVDISIVTPTHRRPDLLERLLRSLAAQSVQRFETYVVDDASGDATPDVLANAARSMPNLHFESFPKGRGPAAARNRGVEMTSGDLILFLDDDVETAPNLIEVHLDRHARAADPKFGLLGRVDWHPDLDISPFMRWVDASGLQFAYDTWLREGPVDPPYGAFYTANLSLHREIFNAAGRFDERFPYPAYEDIELAWRLTKAGFRLDYDPSARVFHTRTMDLSTFTRRMRMVGESAELMHAVQPDVPLNDSDTPAAWPDPPSPLRRRITGIAARVLRDEVRLRRYYRNEISAAYREGTSAGRARAAALSDQR